MTEYSAFFDEETERVRQDQIKEANWILNSWNLFEANLNTWDSNELLDYYDSLPGYNPYVAKKLLDVRKKVRDRVRETIIQRMTEISS